MKNTFAYSCDYCDKCFDDINSSDVHSRLCFLEIKYKELESKYEELHKLIVNNNNNNYSAEINNYIYVINRTDLSDDKIKNIIKNKLTSDYLKK